MRVACAHRASAPRRARTLKSSASIRPVRPLGRSCGRANRASCRHAAPVGDGGTGDDGANDASALDGFDVDSPLMTKTFSRRC